MTDGRSDAHRKGMRILLLTAYFPPDTGSASHLLYELGTALRDLGHQVTVLTGMPGYHPQGELRRYRWRLWVREEIDGLSVLRVAAPRPPRRLVAGRALWQFGLASAVFFAGLLVRKSDVALVYSPPLPLALSAWGIRRLRGIPFVVNVQDLFPQSVIDLGLLKNRFLVRFFKGMERFVYGRADRVTVHAEGNSDHVVANGADPDRVSHAPNWVDTTYIVSEGSGERFRTKHALGDAFVASFAGVLGHSQDLEVVINAAALLRDKRDILWVIVGDGVQKERLERMADDKELHNVRFIPMVPRGEYPEVLYASDACLVTLRADVKTSVVPSKMLSIMAAARPVVAAMNPDGDAPRLIDAAECGYAVGTGDAEALAGVVSRLRDDVDMRGRLGAQGRAYAVANFSLERAAQRHEALFRDMLGEKAVSAGRI